MSGTLADLMDDGVDDTAQEQIDAAAAAAKADATVDEEDDGAAAAAEGGEMDVDGGEEAAGEGEGEGDDGGDDEGEAGFDISSADPKLVKQIQKAVRSVMKKLDTNASYKKSILPQLKDILGKKIVKHNKSLVKEIARQVVQEISNRMENGGADEPEEEDDDDAGAGKDDDDDDYDEKRSSKKKQKQKKRLRKANESDEEDEEPSSKRPSKKSKKDTAAGAKKGAGASASTLALLALPLPKSAFALYSERERDSVLAAHPTADKTEVVRTLQDQWSELAAEAKAEFEAAAEKDRASYEAELLKLKESNPAMYKAHMLAEAKKKRKHDIGDEEDYDDDPDEDDNGDGEEGEGGNKKEAKELSYIDSIISDLKPKRKNKSELSEDDQRLLREAFLARMEKAVELDEKSSAAGKPAIARLNMLSDVQTQISKPTVAKFLVDEGLLRIINAWLAPEADGSLPNIKLRTTLYQLLETLPVEETNLSNSHGLGKRIMKLWSDPEETLANKKLLDAMLQKWMRPMLGLTTNYAKLSEIDEMRAQQIRERKSLMDRQRSAVQMRSNRVRMPEPAHFDYATRPQADVDREEEEEEARDAANAKRNEPLSRKQVLKKRIEQMGRGSANAKPKFKVDITGRASAI